MYGCTYVRGSSQSDSLLVLAFLPHLSIYREKKKRGVKESSQTNHETMYKLFFFSISFLILLEYTTQFPTVYISCNNKKQKENKFKHHLLYLTTTRTLAVDHSVPNPIVSSTE